MGKVILDVSMSLDGFIAGPNDSPEMPLGERGQWLHDWIVDSKTNSLRKSAVLDEIFETTGAIVAGRRVYDNWGGWGGSHPIPGVPVYVLTHDVPEKVISGKTPFIFVTDGIESALNQAKTSAGDKNVYVLGGANIAQQYLKTGLLDEIQIHLVPILIGKGVRLFDQIGTKHIVLESTRIIESPQATHLKFQVVPT
jgi:dihydrofolate reductase